MPNIQSLIEKLLADKSKSTVVDTTLRVGPEIVKKWERLTGFTLPDDYKTYITTAGDCILHKASSSTFAFRIFGLPGVEPAENVFGADGEPPIPKSWFVIADLQDGNYVIMDIASVKKNKVNILDGFHEDMGFELEIIAKSFTEFLERAIADEEVSSGGGGGRRFWKNPEPDYGVVDMQAMDEE